MAATLVPFHTPTGVPATEVPNPSNGSSSKAPSWATNLVSKGPDLALNLYLENSQLCDGRLNLNADSTASQFLKPPYQIADFGLFLAMVEIVIAQFLIGLQIG